MVFFVLIVAIRIPNVPDWAMGSLGLVLLLLCVLTVVFLLLQGVNALRHRNSKKAVSHHQQGEEQT
jgi:TRAP-type C4-dicarboxylate transport system permease small subunit